MKATYTFVTQYLCLIQRISILSILSKTIKFKVAGIIGAISAVFIDHPYLNSRAYGGLVNRTACTDPTPDSVIPILQALGNYSFVSAHPYSGSSNLIPATSIFDLICLKFPHGNFKHLMGSCNVLKVCILHIIKKLKLLTAFTEERNMRNDK